MQSDANAEENTAAGLTLHPRAAWRVAGVQPLPGFRLHVRFNDGLEGKVELSDLIHSPAAGVFAALRDENRFRQVTVVLGAVTWPGDIDLAPDAMYRAIREHGTWRLE